MCDAPNISAFGRNPEWARTCLHFTQWLEMDGMRFSDNVMWTFKGEWKKGGPVTATLAGDHDHACPAAQEEASANHSQ